MSQPSAALDLTVQHARIGTVPLYTLTASKRLVGEPDDVFPFSPTPGTWRPSRTVAALRDRTPRPIEMRVGGP
jgi:hypothetical protein